MPARSTEPEPETPVAELWNLSAKTAAWLERDGIRTFADLQRADLLDVWTRLFSRHAQVTKLMYYALWGAVNNCHWNMITDEQRALIDERVASLRGSR